MDTDVVINKPFDNLLNNRAFMGFSCDCAICTAVIGGEKGSLFYKGIMDMYDSGRYYTEQRYLDEANVEDEYAKGKWAPSNEYWTWYLITTHPQFVLNNKEQVFDDITIYPKHFFELGGVIRTYYCRHTNYNSWRDQCVNMNPLKRVKRWLEKNQKFWTIIRSIKSRQGQKKTSFYKYMEK